MSLRCVRFLAKQRVRVVPSPTIEKLLSRDIGVGRALMVRAVASANRAKELAPVLSGDYRNGIEAAGPGIGPHGTMVARVIGKDFKSGWIEFGTSRIGAQACLRRGCEAIGLKFTSRPLKR